MKGLVMRKGTKHDLSFNKVTLDMAATEECVRIAYGSLINRIRGDSEELLDAMVYEGHTSCITARNLSSAAESLVDVAETLHTIQGMSTRDSIVLVNKREVEEKFKGDKFPELKKKEVK